MGDLNSRIGLRNEEHYDVKPDTRSLHLPTVASQDTRKWPLEETPAINEQLQSYGCYNGRVCGDLAGEFACQWNGLSVVDMLIID